MLDIAAEYWGQTQKSERTNAFSPRGTHAWVRGIVKRTLLQIEISYKKVLRTKAVTNMGERPSQIWVTPKYGSGTLPKVHRAH